MRLAAGHEIDIAQSALRVAGQWRGPGEASGAGSQKIPGLGAGEIVYRRDSGNGAGITPGVAREIEPDRCAVSAEIDDVGGTRAVDVRETNAPCIEQVRR